MPIKKMFKFFRLEEFISTGKSGEDHQFQGKLIHTLQHAVGTGSHEVYKKYSDGIHKLPPINLRDLLDFKRTEKLLH